LADALLWDASHGERGSVDADIWSALALGDSVSELLIGHLINTSIQQGVLEFLSGHAARVSVDTMRQIADCLEEGRYETSLYRAILSEARMAGQTAESFSGMTLEQAQMALQGLHGNSTSVLWSPQNMADACREVAQLERQYAEAMISNDPTLKSAWMDAMHAAEQANPLVADFLPAFGAIEDRAQAMITKFAMTIVGVALLQGRADALQMRLDPWTRKPFGCRATDTGFELSSGLQQNGQSIAMGFRNP
jgi:hypothetical protein